MTKVIRLKESDIQRMVKRVLTEQANTEELKTLNQVCGIWDKMTHQQRSEFRDRKDVSWHIIRTAGPSVDAEITLSFCKGNTAVFKGGESKMIQMVNYPDYKDKNWEYINDIIKTYGKGW